MRQRDIFWFWLPLFASWLLMTAEGPIISAAINRLPNEVIMLAAMGIVTSLSITIESPIINLLATSTALVRDHDSYRLVRRFTIHWCVALTVVAILVAYTPLFNLIVTQWLDVPDEIARWVQPGMKIMIFWSAAIGWRRFLQGIMIRYKQTRKIAYGTAVRLLASGGAVVVLAVWGRWSGVVIGSLGLMAGVLAEAVYATIVVRPLLRFQLAPSAPAAEGTPLTYRSLFWFHLPLAATSFLILLMQPMVTSSLARLDQPTLSLAAWPVLFQILLMARATALALPEVVIALHHDVRTFAPLRRFSIILTGLVTLAMALFVFTPLADWYVFQVQDMTLAVGELALQPVPFPALPRSGGHHVLAARSAHSESPYALCQCWYGCQSVNHRGHPDLVWSSNGPDSRQPRWPSIWPRLVKLSISFGELSTHCLSTSNCSVRSARSRRGFESNSSGVALVRYKIMTMRIIQLPLGPLQTNCYVLACTATNHAAVIDPAWDGRAIQARIQKEGWTATHILLTHTHFDHVGGLGELKELTGAPIYVHPEAIPMLQNAPTAAAMWGFTVEAPPTADQLLNEGDVIEVGELRAEVLFTPGHAPGHVCFYLPEHGVVFDGDVLFQGSIGRTDLPGGDYELLMANIREKLLSLPDETTVLSGHGPATTIGDERMSNPFLNP